jgi:hypothetical protein
MLIVSTTSPSKSFFIILLGHHSSLLREPGELQVLSEPLQCSIIPQETNLIVFTENLHIRCFNRAVRELDLLDDSGGKLLPLSFRQRFPKSSVSVTTANRFYISTSIFLDAVKKLFFALFDSGILNPFLLQHMQVFSIPVANDPSWVRGNSVKSTVTYNTIKSSPIFLSWLNLNLSLLFNTVVLLDSIKNPRWMSN